MVPVTQLIKELEQLPKDALITFDINDTHGTSYGVWARGLNKNNNVKDKTSYIFSLELEQKYEIGEIL
jgi:hypothetical protein